MDIRMKNIALKRTPPLMDRLLVSDAVIVGKKDGSDYSGTKLGVS
jgi:hypothetical protein